MALLGAIGNAVKGISNVIKKPTLNTNTPNPNRTENISGVGNVNYRNGTPNTIGTSRGSYNNTTGNWSIDDFKTGKTITGNGSYADYEKAYNSLSGSGGGSGGGSSSLYGNASQPDYTSYFSDLQNNMSKQYQSMFDSMSKQQQTQQQTLIDSLNKMNTQQQNQLSEMMKRNQYVLGNLSNRNQYGDGEYLFGQNPQFTRPAENLTSANQQQMKSYQDAMARLLQNLNLWGGQ